MTRIRLHRGQIGLGVLGNDTLLPVVVHASCAKSILPWNQTLQKSGPFVVDLPKALSTCSDACLHIRDGSGKIILNSSPLQQNAVVHQIREIRTPPPVLRITAPRSHDPHALGMLLLIFCCMFLWENLLTTKSRRRNHLPQTAPILLPPPPPVLPTATAPPTLSDAPLHQENDAAQEGDFLMDHSLAPSSTAAAFTSQLFQADDGLVIGHSQVKKAEEAESRGQERKQRTGKEEWT